MDISIEQEGREREREWLDHERDEDELNFRTRPGKVLPPLAPLVSPPSGTPFDCLRSIINAARREHVKVDSLRLI